MEKLKREENTFAIFIFFTLKIKIVKIKKCLLNVVNKMLRRAGTDNINL